MNKIRRKQLQEASELIAKAQGIIESVKDEEQDQFNDDYEVRDVIEAFYDCMIEKILNYIGAE